MEATTPIQHFYKDQTIFITGGTGFIGKVLIEKLLRSCADLRVIYIMVRAKKEKNADQRFSEIFDFPCFDVLKSQKPNFAEKVRLINGDCEQSGLGLSLQDREILTKETNIFVHAAANVRFDQELRLATLNNIKAVEEILELAKEMPKLKALVHVSTAYANCHQKCIDEKFYEPGMEARHLYSLLEAVDDETLKNITPELIKKWPNTYTYTKCIAEDLIRREGADLPVAIVRPGIIVCTVNEPVPGWVDNFYGFIGCATGIMVGVVKNLNCQEHNMLHAVPCDFTVNNIIASAWHLQNQPSKLLIYNYVGSKKNFFTIAILHKYLDKYRWTYPTSFMIWFPFLKTTSNTFWYEIRVFFQHTMVSYILDFILICLRKKPVAVKKFKQVNTLLKLISPFILNSFYFETDNVEKLAKEMSEEDRQLFKLDLNEVDWEKFWVNSLIYARQFLLKEPLDKIPVARRKIKIFAGVHYIVVALLYYLLYKLILFVFNIF